MNTIIFVSVSSIMTMDYHSCDHVSLHSSVLYTYNVILIVLSPFYNIYILLGRFA